MTKPNPQTTPVALPAPQFPMPDKPSEYTKAWMDGWRAAWTLIQIARGETSDATT